jgi:PAS domain S-box
MSDILFIAPNQSIASSAENVKNKYNLDMDVLQEGLKEWEELYVIKEYLEKFNTKIIMSRGGMALYLRKHIDIPVVEVKITLSDVTKALVEAKRIGKNVLFVGFSNHIRGIESLSGLVGFNIKEIILDEWHDIKNVLENAVKDKIDVVVGGAIQNKMAKEMGITSVFLDTGENAIYSTYLDAKELLRALFEQERRLKEIHTILDYTKEGFIAIDALEQITLVNRTASIMVGINIENLIGQNIKTVLPELQKMVEALEGMQSKGDIITIGKNSFLYSYIPVKGMDKTVGVMATLKSVSVVRDDESRIRLKQYQAGLYANYTFEDIVGSSKAIVAVKEQAKGYAGVDSTVLIVSDSGTGKELFAQSIHNASMRSEGPFVAINCASLSNSILESELFGYVEGAFTGAKRGGKAGMFETANNGTIFLDEIGELSADIQGKLLRVLQERCIMRLGDTKIHPINVRVIAATNKNLVEEVREKRFRQDLFFRLDILRLKVPLLRERKEDIPLLCDIFLKRYGSNRPLILNKHILKSFDEYSWPGNVRELENVIERLGVCNSDDIENLVKRHIAEMEPLAETKDIASVEYKDIDKKIIADALEYSKGNKKKAAEMLGIHRSTIYRHLADKK